MWTQISLIWNLIRRVSSKPDRSQQSARPGSRAPCRAAAPAPGGFSGLPAAPPRSGPRYPRLPLVEGLPAYFPSSPARTHRFLRFLRSAPATVVQVAVCGLCTRPSQLPSPGGVLSPPPVPYVCSSSALGNFVPPLKPSRKFSHPLHMPE